RTANEIEIRSLFVALVPKKRFLVRDILYVIRTDQPRPFLRLRYGVGVRDVLRGDEPFERAADAKFFGERASVDALNARNAILFEVLRERKIRAPVADDGRKFANDRPGDVRAPGVDVDAVQVVVAD